VQAQGTAPSHVESTSTSQIHRCKRQISILLIKFYRPAEDRIFFTTKHASEKITIGLPLKRLTQDRIKIWNIHIFAEHPLEYSMLSISCMPVQKTLKVRMMFEATGCYCEMTLSKFCFGIAKNSEKQCMHKAINWFKIRHVHYLSLFFPSFSPFVIIFHYVFPFFFSILCFFIICFLLFLYLSLCVSFFLYASLFFNSFPSFLSFPNFQYVFLLFP
jgi:hypothetical protein